MDFTELKEPLEEAKRLAEGNHAKECRIFVLTDGEVLDKTKIFKVIENIPKNTKKRKIWLFVWYLNSPPSVEYMANILTIPKIKIENTRM